MQNSESKLYPAASEELTRLFGFGSAVSARLHTEHHEVNASHEMSSRGAETEPDTTPRGASVRLSVLKAMLPYLTVFAVAALVFYFFFSSVDFSKVFRRTEKPATPKETAIAGLQKQGLDDYYAWVHGFYFDVSNESIVDPNADNSGNGLSNFQKYLLNLNPKSYDSSGLGMADSEALAQGLNPLTGKALTETQAAIIKQYFDLEVIMNRLAVARLRTAQAKVAGVQVRGESEFPAAASSRTTVFGNTGEVSNLPVGVPSAPPPLNAQGLVINTGIPARLEVPSLGINVPIIFSNDPKDFDRDLQVGVVHYPGTALPGQIGTTYISGHSSNFAWAKGSYNRVFSKLGNLADNTSFKITVVQENGKDARLHYVVIGRKEFQATDPEQFKNGGKSTVALSTCWPVGSTAKRLVVFGELTQVERD